MWKKVKDVVMLIRETEKPGRKIIWFYLFKMILRQLTDCGISLLLPILIINAYENEKYIELVWFVVIFFVGVFLLSVLLERIDGTYICKQHAEVSKKVLSKIFWKISDSDISRFDDTVFYEKHIFNMNLIEEKVNDAIKNISEIISGIIIFCINISLIISMSKNTWMFVAVSLLLTVVLQYFQTRFNLQYQKKAMPFNRRAEVLGHFFMDYDYAKEIRDYKKERMLLEQVMLEKKAAIDLFRKSKPKFIWYSFAKIFVSTFLLRVIFLVYLTYRCLVFKDYSYAGVLLVYNASINLYGILNLFVETFSKYDDISLYAEQYFEISGYQNEIVSGTKILDHFESLEFRNVTFRYEGTDRDVLNQVSFKVSKGQKIAIVGRNGNGKTTLIKLLLRMYEPITGEILVNSVNIKEYNLDSYRYFFGMLFQDLGMFNATIRENLGLGHEPDVDLHEIMKDVGIYEQIDRLEKKMDTPYGVEIFEDGAILSGGEQQRLLVGRALVKNAEIILMDEPTSHIDPAADIEFSNMIFNKLTNKTVLFITHRLISTKRADCIIVLKNEGQIESGTHRELMLYSELYKKMYEAQKKNYSLVGEFAG